MRDEWAEIGVTNATRLWWLCATIFAARFASAATLPAKTTLSNEAIPLLDVAAFLPGGVTSNERPRYIPSVVRHLQIFVAEALISRILDRYIRWLALR
jgi:hypothetical protein